MSALTVTTLVLTASVVVTLFVVLRSGRLREKYVALWGVIGLAIVVLALWPGLLTTLSLALGFQIPANLLFFMAILMLMGICLHLSLESSKLEDETRRLAEEVAILREAIDRHERRERLP